MPAHIGIREKLLKYTGFIWLNVAQNESGRTARNGRVAKKNVLVHDGRATHNHRAAYLSWGKYSEAFDDGMAKREAKFTDYVTFRRYLDSYNPNKPNYYLAENVRPTCDRNEWDLYLKPGTAFDNFCQQYFDDNEDD